jgi:hypothetical protein
LSELLFLIGTAFSHLRLSGGTIDEVVVLTPPHRVAPRLLAEYLQFFSDIFGESLRVCHIPLHGDVWDFTSVHPSVAVRGVIVPQFPELANLCHVCQEAAILLMWETMIQKRFFALHKSTAAREANLPTTAAQVVAIIKLDKMGVHDTKRFFEITEATRLRFAELGIFLIREDTPKPLRMWFLTHATVLIDSSGANADVNTYLLSPWSTVRRRITLVHPSSELLEHPRLLERGGVCMNDQIEGFVQHDIPIRTKFGIVDSDWGLCPLFTDFRDVVSCPMGEWWFFCANSTSLDSIPFEMLLKGI